RAVGDSCMRAERGRDCRGNFVVGFQGFPLSFVVLKKEPRARNGLPGRSGSTAAPDQTHGAPAPTARPVPMPGLNLDTPRAGRHFHTPPIRRVRLVRYNFVTAPSGVAPVQILTRSPAGS